MEIASLSLFRASALLMESSPADLQELYQLSLEELVEVKTVTASVVPIKLSDTPAAVTVITREDIAQTPARNLVDLINTYVPGALSMAHPEGPKIGTRGVITSNNLKHLLLVNGVNVTEKSKNGVISEIDHWNLEDIEKVEVIRGPGAVTFGPGAIGGVIKITTKTDATFQGTRAGLNAVSDYRGRGVFLEHGRSTKDLGLYAFASFQRTDGLEDGRFYNDDTLGGSPYDGDNSGTGPSQYLADPLGKPQFKLHSDFRFGKNLRWWTRYSQSGQVYYGEERQRTKSGLSSTDQLEQQNIITSLSHEWKLSNTSTLESTFSFDSHNKKVYNIRDVDYRVDDILNQKISFSESELFLRVNYRKNVTSDFVYVVGGEVSYDWVRAPWFQSEKNFFLKEGVSMISGSNSNYVGDGAGAVDPNDNNTISIGEGWETSLSSLYFESNLKLSSSTQLLKSLRLDKHSLADAELSPRLALVHDINQGNKLKLVAQRSVRLLRNSALFVADRLKEEASPEILKSAELTWASNPMPHLHLSTHLFFQELDVVAFSGLKSRTVGEVRSYGLEWEGTLKKDKWTLSASHGLTKQREFEVNADLKSAGSSRQGISVADYNYVRIYITLLSEGNDLNNWHNQSTKLAFTYRLGSHWSLHTNAVLRWGMQGAKDELRMFERAYDAVDVTALSAADQITFNQERTAALEAIETLREKNAFSLDGRVNLSIMRSFEMKAKEMGLSLNLHNLLRINKNKHYYYSTGSSGSFPNRANFIEEPFFMDLKFTTTF